MANIDAIDGPDLILDFKAVLEVFVMMPQSQTFHCGIWKQKVIMCPPGHTKVRKP